MTRAARDFVLGDSESFGFLPQLMAVTVLCGSADFDFATLDESRQSTISSYRLRQTSFVGTLLELTCHSRPETSP